MSDLKVGDEVYVENDGIGGFRRIDIVLAITKAGNIKTKESGIFNPLRNRKGRR